MQYPVIAINDPGSETYVTVRPAVRRTAYSQSPVPSTTSSSNSRQKQKQKQKQKQTTPPVETVVAKKPKAKQKVVSSPTAQEQETAGTSAPRASQQTTSDERADAPRDPVWYDGVRDDALGGEESRQWTTSHDTTIPAALGPTFSSHDEEENVWSGSDRAGH